MPKIRILSAEDVRAALPMAEAIGAAREAFAQMQRGEATVPPRAHIDVADHRGVALFMPSLLPRTGRMGVKAITLFDGNPAIGMPRIQAVMLVLDAENGAPLAVMDAGTLTALRTGAGSGVATDLLARPDADSVAILGAGNQARTQLEAVCCVRPVRRVWVVDPARPAAEGFAEEMSTRLGVPVRVAADASEALRDASIVCAATVAVTPVFADADLQPGAHVNAIGSYKPRVQEIPSATMARARVVVDHLASALDETGDLLIPIGEGVFSADRVHAEIGEVLLGTKPGRATHDEITVYKSVGVAVMDLAAAALALDRAERMGLGTEAML
ncbi:MAG: ornithine cyclodeaminase family protein [Armatimonadetes bacterium]|nr:ornithine cyclodeaminase family protein [Armatimonadota bacterium]